MSKSIDVSVVVPVRDIDDRLTALIRMLDGQQLPYSRYDLVFVDLGSSDRTSHRLATLVGHRPNVTILEAEDRPSAWRVAVDRARGEYTVLLSPRDRLQPAALAALLDRAVDGDLDVVLGRHLGPGPVGFVPDAVDHPWDADAPDAAIAMLAPLALLRTSLLRTALSAPSAGWRSDRLQLLTATEAIDLLDTSPVAAGNGPGDEEPTSAIWSDVDAAAEHLSDRSMLSRFVAAHAATIATPGDDSAALATEIVRRRIRETDLADLPPAQRMAAAAILDATGAGKRHHTPAERWNSLDLTVDAGPTHWINGALRIDVTVTVTIPDGELPAGFNAVTAGLVLHDASGTTSYRVPTRIGESDYDPQRVSFQISADVDASTAADGAALERGMWRPAVRLQGTGAGFPAVAGVPFTATTGALVDGQPIQPYAEGTQLRLDVGALKHGFLGRPTPADCSISESSAGSKLVVRLTEVAVRGEVTLPGRLYLGKLSLPAQLIADDSGISIACHLSGLAGVSTLAAQFAPAAKQPLGVQLRISDVGDMAIESTPPKPSAAKPGPKRGPAKSSKPGPAHAASITKQTAAANSTQSKRSDRGTGPRRPRNTSRAYPDGRSLPSDKTFAQKVLPAFKPAGVLLPGPLRRRARRAYRRLTR